MEGEGQSLEMRPGICFIGSSNVGKRTLISRLVSVDFEDTSDSESRVLHGWTINTKYYKADVSICVSHLNEGFSDATLPIHNQLVALVMVFDLNNPPSLVALQDWVSSNDLQRYEILLCVGNKVDLVPGHPVHSEYRRRLLKLGDSSSVSDLELADYGISETEGSSLLGDDGPSWEVRRSCLEWCAERNIEYIEACASNVDFDKCLSVDGDLQGVERLFGALSAHMWPGMILKSGDKISGPSLLEKDVSEEESDYEFDYEILSAGSVERWDDGDTQWVSASHVNSASNTEGLPAGCHPTSKSSQENGSRCGTEEMQPSTSVTVLHDETNKGGMTCLEEPDQERRQDESSPFDFEDLDKLMSEIGNVRDNLRLMPDFQRRETAAKLALKMAAMFGGESDNEVEI